MPEPGGSIEALNSLLNRPSRNDFVLIVAWLLGAFRSGGPYPLLAISGEQGSAKTVQSAGPPVRALSRERRELMIAANNSYLLAFDNLSGLPHLALRCSLPACHWRQLRPCGSSLPTLRLTFGPRSARSS
jgi:hypothetical protein